MMMVMRAMMIIMMIWMIMVIANFLKFCFITTNTSIHTMMMVMMIMIKMIWMVMVIANVSIILFNYHQHWHTHHDDGYDDLDDNGDCKFSKILFYYHQY